MPAAVRGKSAGLLSSGGKASAAISVIAVVKPTAAEQKMIAAFDGRNISPRNEANSSGPKIRNGQARRAIRSAMASNKNGVTICAPLSQPSAGPSRCALPSLAKNSPRNALVEKYALLLLPSVSPSSQTSGLFHSGHQRPPIALSAAVFLSRFGLSKKKTGAISSAGTAHSARSSRQLPPASGNTNG